MALTLTENTSSNQTITNRYNRYNYQSFTMMKCVCGCRVKPEVERSNPPPPGINVLR